MSVKVSQEPSPELPYERCCFCRTPTPFWVFGADVACCTACAYRAHPSDVPSKTEWCNRERIASHTWADQGWQSKGTKRARHASTCPLDTKGTTP